MKLAIAYSTKDQVELTDQTLPRLMKSVNTVEHGGPTLWWCDGSRTDKGRKIYRDHAAYFLGMDTVFGGADAAIAWKLSKLLAAGANYTHIGLLENDVLLDEDWFEPTMALFGKGKADGLAVGAVSPRSYVDRVLIQRDGYAVMHNIGAGTIIFTRAAAEIILRSFRTAWWPDNVRLFAMLSGIDLRTYAAFRGNEQWVTTDWGWEAQLARHGLAALALTPAKCQMIGQNPPLEQQGLELVTNRAETKYTDDVFRKYVAVLDNIQKGYYVPELPGIIHRDGAGMLIFPHQLGAINALIEKEQWELQWSQGFSPFAYRAGKNPDGVGGASLSVRVSGSCSFLCGGGTTGGKVAITDTRSGFNFAPELPANMDQFASINVPGGPVPRRITCEMAEGTVFYGLQTTDPQLLDSTFKFSWDQLPKAV